MHESPVVEKVAECLSRDELVDFDAAERSASTRREKQLVRNLHLVRKVAEAARTQWNASDADHTLLLRDGDALAARVDPSVGSTPALETWGPLNLLEKLGAGAFGEVYRAWDTRLNRAVALKLLRASADRAPQAEDTLNEARLLAKVEHPHVARVYGLEQHDDRVGIWMELVDGTDLKSLVHESGPLDPREVASVAAQVARALEAIHAAGVLHRDIKPQNILRTPQGRAVLVDLGAGQWRRLRQGPRDISGTPHYMAPEVLLAGQPASPRSDVYSLGVTMFHALTGELPVCGNMQEICEAHGRGERRRMAELRPDVPARLREIVEKACHPRSEERYARASDLAQELEAWLAPPRWTRRRVLSRAAAAAAIGVAIVALVWKGPSFESGPLSAQVQLSGFRDGDWVPLAVNDAVTAEDEVQITLQLNREAYVYVFNRDATGSTVVLFPMAGGGPQNPLAPGRPQSLPGTINGRRMGWGFTPVEGFEEFLVLASEVPLVQFEQEMDKHAAVDVGGGLKVRALDRESMDVAMQNARGVMGILEVDERQDPQADLFSLVDQIAQQNGPDLWMQRLRLRNDGR